MSLFTRSNTKLSGVFTLGICRRIVYASLFELCLSDAPNSIEVSVLLLSDSVIYFCLFVLNLSDVGENVGFKACRVESILNKWNVGT